MLRDMASRADERMVLDTTDSNRVVREHVGQDQLGATGSYNASLAPEGRHIERPRAIGEYRSFAPCAAVLNYL